VEKSSSADKLRVVEQVLTTPFKYLLNLFNVFRPQSDERFIEQGPQPLSRLQLWGRRWQEEQLESIWNLKSLARVPPGSIEHQNHPLLRPYLERLCHVFEHRRMHLRVHPLAQPHLELSARGMHPGPDVSPLISWLHSLSLAFSDLAPRALRRGLEADAMLVHRPNLDLRFRVVLLELLKALCQIFFSTAHACSHQQIWCASVDSTCRSSRET